MDDTPTAVAGARPDLATFREPDRAQAERLLSLGIDEDSVRRLLDAVHDARALQGHLPGALGSWSPREPQDSELGSGS